MSNNKLQVTKDHERKLMAINARARKDDEMRMKGAPVFDSSGRSNNRWSYKALVCPTAFYTFLVPTRCAKEPHYKLELHQQGRYVCLCMRLSL